MRVCAWAILLVVLLASCGSAEPLAPPLAVAQGAAEGSATVEAHATQPTQQGESREVSLVQANKDKYMPEQINEVPQGNTLSKLIIVHRRFFYDVVGIVLGLILFTPKFLFLFPAPTVPHLNTDVAPDDWQTQALNLEELLKSELDEYLQDAPRSLHKWAGNTDMTIENALELLEAERGLLRVTGDSANYNSYLSAFVFDVYTDLQLLISLRKKLYPDSNVFQQPLFMAVREKVEFDLDEYEAVKKVIVNHAASLFPPLKSRDVSVTGPAPEPNKKRLFWAIRRFLLIINFIQTTTNPNARLREQRRLMDIILDPTQHALDPPGRDELDDHPQLLSSFVYVYEERFGCHEPAIRFNDQFLLLTWYQESLPLRLISEAATFKGVDVVGVQVNLQYGYVGMTAPELVPAVPAWDVAAKVRPYGEAAVGGMLTLASVSEPEKLRQQELRQVEVMDNVRHGDMLEAKLPMYCLVNPRTRRSCGMWGKVIGNTLGRTSYSNTHGQYEKRELESLLVTPAVRDHIRCEHSWDKEKISFVRVPPPK